MIKKILSVALTIAMLLTLVSSLPVAAAGDNLPYIFENFEAISDDDAVAGPYGIGKALKTAGVYSKDITGLDALFAGNVKVSFNIKADEDTTAKIVLVNEYELSDTLPANEWVAIEETIAVDSLIADTFAITADAAFTIDDLKVENADVEARPDDAAEVEGVERFAYDFEADIADVSSSIVGGENVGSLSHANREGFDRSYALKHTLSAGTNATARVEITPETNPKKYNTVTKVEFWAKSDHSKTAGATVAFTTGGENVSYGGEGVTTEGGKAKFETPLRSAGDPYVVYYKNNTSETSPAPETDKFIIEISGTEDEDATLTFCIDEIVVTDYYLPANADFDVMIGEDVWGWTASNATVEAVAGAAEVTATAANPSISQRVAFENDYKYTISFSAKASEGDTLVVSVGNTVKEIALSETMSEYYIIYRAEVDGDLAYPELKFALKDAAAEDVFSIDAIEVVKESNYKLANAEDVEVTGNLVEKNTLTVSYDEAVDEDIAVVATVANLFQVKGDYAVCVGTTTETSSENEVAFELPANCAGDEFYVEVICFTDAGQGLTVMEEIGAVSAAVEYESYSADLVDSTATVSLTLASNRAEGADDIKAIILVVLLDESGVLVGFDTEEVVIAAGESNDFALEVAATNGVADSFKVFVLDCGESAPSLANATMRELVTLS